MNPTLHNFLRGAGSIFLIAPPPRTLAPNLPFLDRSDAEALASDWRMVGADLRAAIRTACKGVHSGTGEQAQSRAAAGDGDNARHGAVAG
jgi:hypothetical protein